MRVHDLLDFYLKHLKAVHQIIIIIIIYRTSPNPRELHLYFKYNYHISYHYLFNSSCTSYQQISNSICLALQLSIDYILGFSYFCDQMTIINKKHCHYHNLQQQFFPNFAKFSQGYTSFAPAKFLSNCNLVCFPYMKHKLALCRRLYKTTFLQWLWRLAKIDN